MNNSIIYFNDHNFLQIHINKLWIHVLMIFFLQWAIWLAYHQKVMKFPFSNLKWHFLRFLHLRYFT
jgi:hypothetical protein